MTIDGALHLVGSQPQPHEVAPEASQQPETVELFDNTMSSPDSLNALGRLRRLGGQVVHGIVDDGYSEKFRAEFKQRHTFVASDGVSLTARVLNPEFLDNEQHAIVYNYSLTVPAKHGAELPTVADIAAHGEKSERVVIAVTTDGLAGPLDVDQLKSLTNFWSIPPRRFELLRDLLPDGKKLIATGSSLGGNISHAMAATFEDEAERSGHSLEVTNVIAIASIGHEPYSFAEKLALGKQFVLDEPLEAVGYILAAPTPRQKVQRALECMGSFPLHARQHVAIACTALGIMDAPLYGIEHKMPLGTRVVDVTFSQDDASQPHRRALRWQAAGHPNVDHRDEEGRHLRLLTLGRRITLDALDDIPIIRPTQAPAPSSPARMQLVRDL